MYVKLLKPSIDFLMAGIGLLLLSPIFLLTTIALAVANGGSPFFLQRRPGKHEKIFRIIKFKTMNDKRDAAGELLPDSQRLTTIGRWVRKTSLDEIPQLLNVLKGEMSFIGPRPLLPEYLSLYSSEQKKRHDVRPGISGWAQVNGRNAISWEEKLSLDSWYVAHISLGLDLKILGMTIKRVLSGSGVSADGEATTTKFKGNNT